MAATGWPWWAGGNPAPTKPEPMPTPAPEGLPARVRYDDMNLCCVKLLLTKNPMVTDIVACQECGTTSYYLRGAWSSRAWMRRVGLLD